MIAALPVVATAFVGFARQPWGEPFKWPLGFGNLKTIAISLSLMFGWFVVSVALAQLYVEITDKPFPYQHMIPFSRALQANPVVAWLGVVFVIPCTEEILFRGLRFGAFQKLWGVRGALIATSILFVFYHLRLIGSLTLLLLALILGWARVRSGSVGLPIALHALNNALVLTVLTFGLAPK